MAHRTRDPSTLENTNVSLVDLCQGELLWFWVDYNPMIWRTTKILPVWSLTHNINNKCSNFSNSHSMHSFRSTQVLPCLPNLFQSAYHTHTWSTRSPIPSPNVTNRLIILLLSDSTYHFSYFSDSKVATFVFALHFLASVSICILPCLTWLWLRFFSFLLIHLYLLLISHCLPTSPLLLPQPVPSSLSSPVCTMDIVVRPWLTLHLYTGHLPCTLSVLMQDLKPKHWLSLCLHNAAQHAEFLKQFASSCRLRHLQLWLCILHSLFESISGTL